ncbi:hypothetical protein [Leifsonia sp. EB34]|uniref:hypothetical protein n=1 Tax=Leifsonia sp. EB34 TaxID=3156303 RepID=UPI00351309D2
MSLSWASWGAYGKQGASGGAALSVLTWLVLVRIQHTFTVPIPHAVYFWFASSVSAIALALANLRQAGWRRRSIAVAAIVVFATTGTVNINAQFGLDRTVGGFRRNPA